MKRFGFRQDKSGFVRLYRYKLGLGLFLLHVSKAYWFIAPKLPCMAIPVCIAVL